MGNKNIMGSDNEIPQILNELSNPWSNGKGNNGVVNMDGNQKNGRNGSPLITPTSGDTNVPDFGGINYDNTQISFGSINMTMDDNMQWEKNQGVLINPTGKFQDKHNGFRFDEVDLSKPVQVIGMPTENSFGNSSTDCYGV